MSAGSSDVPIFVYGTLRRGAGHPMARLLSEHARPLGAATLCGVLFDVGPYPAAVASDDPLDVLHGEVYALRRHRADQVLGMLDHYEGCPGGEDGPALYVRSRRNVTLEDERTLEAWVWLWNRSAEGLRRIDDGDWLRHVAGA